MKRKNLFIIICFFSIAILVTGCFPTKKENSSMIKENKNSVSSKHFKFNSQDIDGKTIVSDKLFKDYKLTMVNLWTTDCSPCIREMPDIQRLYEEVKKDKINIIGIVLNVVDEDVRLSAKDIINKLGVNYINIIPNKEIIETIAEDARYTPTTFFVDSKGNIVGKPIIGAKSKKQYKEEINAMLEK